MWLVNPRERLHALCALRKRQLEQGTVRGGFCSEPLPPACLPCGTRGLLGTHAAAEQVPEPGRRAQHPPGVRDVLPSSQSETMECFGSVTD